MADLVSSVRHEDNGILDVPVPPESEILDLIHALWAEPQWATAECIARHESGLGTNLVPSETDDWGVFQLNRPTWQPFFMALGWGWNPLEAEWNIAAARVVYDRAGGWSPWATHSSSGGRC